MSALIWSFAILSSGLGYGQQVDLKKPNLTLLEAISWTLHHDNLVKVEQSKITREKGTAREAMAPFDLVTTARVQQSYSPFWSEFQNPLYEGYNFEANGGVRKTLRCGTQIDTLLNFTQKPSSLYGSSPSSLLDTLRVNIDVRQPLLRGFWHGSDRMNECAAYQEYQAVTYESLFVITSRVATTLARYWDVVAENQRYVVLKKAALRYQKLLQATSRLVEEKRIPKSEIFQAKAELARQLQEKTAALFAYQVAVQQLYLEMGFVEDAFLIDPSSLLLESFPSLESLQVRRDPHRLVELAYDHRLDYQANFHRVRRFEFLAKGAQNEQLPQLDMIGSYKEPVRGELDGQGRDLKEWSIGASLSYPLFNDGAKGRYVRERALLSEAMHTQQQSALEIKAQVLEAWYNHLSLLIQVEEAQKAVKNFKSSLESEVKRLKLGLSTIFQVTEFENRLTSAETRLIDTQLALAKNLITIRQQSGLLMTYSPQDRCLIASDVKTIPF